MTEVMIKPLRTYEDRGEIRKGGSDPYPAPLALARELKSLGLCSIVDQKILDGERLALEPKHIGRGKWVVTDVEGNQVGEFSGTKDEVLAEIERLSSKADQE